MDNTNPVLPSQQSPTKPAIPTQPQSTVHRWMMLILLLTFPPIAWRYMWKDHRYHSWFLYILVLNGLGMLGLFGYFLFFAYPELVKLFRDLHIPEASTKTIFVIHIGFLVLGVFELLLGTYLKFSRKDMQILSKPLIALIIFLLFLNLLALPISQAAIASGFYNLTSSEIETITNASLTPIPISDPMVNWKTYANKTYSFSFKYPPDWVIKKESADQVTLSKTVRSKTEKCITECPSPDVFISFFITENLKNFQTIDDWLTQEIQKRNLTDFTPEAKYLTIDGQKALETAFPSRFGENWVVVFYNNYILTVYTENQTTEDEKLVEEVKKQILSTFKFQNQNPMISPTCIPRPACLDSEPRCMIPETPDMCPTK